ncbi:glycosyltransferase family 2 protein [Tatumella sp. JGM118]|uniref:glycosyltransferase family 2 protein n=1 Tax=Tatumella sp. JGM118 TaxID=2799796 RepID=UPI001BAFBE0D|nr:glycosyltransferase family 2 protein [Tatumella sp. JGM118]MBS0910039.1 glycosyltransferase family 2 protein [Tatumella sp. JGM118]
MKVSICVPAYNVDNYIKECLDSLSVQTMTDFEVLVINDGSTDKTKEIVQSFCNKDARFKLVDTPNGGLAAARNTALDLCSGDFILMLDSDDYLDKECLTIALNEIGDNDILVFNYYKDLDGKIIKNKEHNLTNTKKYSDVEILAIEAICLEPTAWGKLYKRTVFSSIRYPVGMLYEDYAVVYDVVSNKNIKIINDHLYFYRIRNGSIMRSFSKKHIDDKVAILSSLKSKLGINRPDENAMINISFCNSYIFHLVFVTSNMIYNSSKNIDADLKYLNSILDKNSYNLSNILRSESIPLGTKVYLVAFKINPKLSFLLKSLLRIVKDKGTR